MEGCKNFLTSGRRLVEESMNQRTEKNTIKRKKKTRKKLTKYIMEKEKTKGRIKKEGRVRVTEKK